jgi:hypothetical protein
MAEKIDMAALTGVANTFTKLRSEIDAILREHLVVDGDGYTVKGHEAASEALIFYFAEALATPTPQDKA